MAQSEYRFSVFWLYEQIQINLIEKAVLSQNKQENAWTKETDPDLNSSKYRTCRIAAKKEYYFVKSEQIVFDHAYDYCVMSVLFSVHFCHP